MNVQLSRMRVALSVAALVLAGLVLAGSGATQASSDVAGGIRAGPPHPIATSSSIATLGAGGTSMGANAARPRTIAVVPMRIQALDADGPFLAWSGYTRRWTSQFFERRFRRLRTATWPMSLGVFAGSRVLTSSGDAGNTVVWGDVYSAAIRDRHARHVRHFELGKYPVGNYYGVPTRIAAGGGTLVFFGVDGGGWDPQHQRTGVWRMVGSHPKRLAYKPPLLADIAAASRRLATLNWVTACGCDRFPAWSPDGREIAWNHDGAIWLMRADGSDQRRVSGEGAADRDSTPRWSPSGGTLAFERDGAIYLIGRDGSNEKRLVSGSLPDWSPDGSGIAFVRADELWLVGSDGSGERRLTSDALKINSRPDWSPDGRSIVVARGVLSDLFLVDVETGAERNLTPAGLYDSDPAWSPDGSAIAFSAWDKANGYPPWIALVRADGGGLRKLSRPSGDYDDAPAWSPDGRRLVYVGSGDPFGEIHVINADGSGQKRLKVQSDQPSPPTWSTDGSKVLVGDALNTDEDRPRGGIYLLDPAGGPPTTLAPASLLATVEVRDSHSGRLLRHWQLLMQRSLRHMAGSTYGSVAISGRYALATYWRYRVGYVLERYDIATGTVLGRGRFPTSASRVELAGGRGVYRVGRRIYLLDVRTGRRSPLVVTGSAPVGPVIEGRRVFWAEAYREGSRVRGLVYR